VSREGKPGALGRVSREELAGFALVVKCFGAVDTYAFMAWISGNLV
jgi:hypothetical protein